MYHARDLTETAHELDAPLTAPDRYQVFVRAADVFDVSRWSTPMHFDLGLPAAPTISGPASRTADATPAVTWNRSDGAAAYQLQIYSVTRGQLLYDEIGLTGTSHTVAAPLEAQDTYQVFVRSINSEGMSGRWEPPRHFDLVLPEAPTILAPGPVASTATPTITWSHSQGAAAYDVEIYSTTRGRLVGGTSGLRGTAYHVSAPLETGENYAVYVRAVNSQGEAGRWSKSELSTDPTLSTMSCCLNHPPTASDDSYSGPHDMTLSRPAPGVLENDSDFEGDPLTAVLESGPSFAESFMLYDHGGFDYKPPPNWSGPDSFTYRASDGAALSEPATVQIYMTNIPPTAEDDEYGVAYNTPEFVPAPGVLANDWDGDGDSVSAVCGPGPTPMGGMIVSCNPDGSFEYDPPAGFTGTDSFTYSVTDGMDQSNEPATVWFNVFRPWADIDIDSNNDTIIDPEDDPALGGTDDPIEDIAPGQFIAVNDDDDNQNLEWDLNDSPVIDPQGNGDFDLVPANLGLDFGFGATTGSELPNFSGFEVVVEASSELRLWLNQDKTGPIPSGTGWTLNEVGVGYPGTIYVEGYEPSAAEGGGLADNDALEQRGGRRGDQQRPRRGDGDRGRSGHRFEQ